MRVGASANAACARVRSPGDPSVCSCARQQGRCGAEGRHPGPVLSRQQLLSHVWGYDLEPGSNVVDVYVGYLRRKLGKELITSVRGMGYRLEPPTTENDE